MSVTFENKERYDNLIQRIGHKPSATNVEKINTKDIEEALSSIVPNQVLAYNKLTENDFRILDNIVTKKFIVTSVILVV